MAHGWDSYFHNVPSLSSDPSTLRKPSESEEGLSQNIENFIGHDDFPDAVASHDVPPTNTNYYSNPSMENPSSDCLYQRYCNETSWQGDGEQMEKDYMPKCENSDISDFATDGLSTSESFPSSFATDLQELKQDCGMLATSFIEDYSDVSSCSDADVGETRPSCKFMTSCSVPKPKTYVTTNPSSSEWLFTDTGTMMVSTESGKPNILETNAILPSTSNVMTGENIVEYAQDKMETPEKHINSYTGQSSSTCDMATTAGSETGEDGNDCAAGTDGKKRNMREDECDKSDVLKREKETFDGASPNPKSADSQDENVESNCQEKDIQSYTSQSLDILGISISDSKEPIDELGSICQRPAVMSGGHFSSTNGKIEHVQASVASCSEPCSSTEASLHLERERTSQTEKKNTSSSPDPHCNSPGVTSDSPSIGTSDKNEQVAVPHVKSCLWTNSSSTDINPCLGKESTSPAEKKSTSSAGPDWGDPAVSGDDKELCVSNCIEFPSQSSTSSKDSNLHLQTEWRSLAANANPTMFPGQEQSLHQSPEATEDLNGDVDKNAFEEMDTSAEEPSMLGVVYGEPLSREDSSCDSDETKLDTGHNEDTSVGRPYSNSMDCTVGQAPQLKSSLQMRKRLQPIVILKTSESINVKSNSYHCADCQHTTHNVDLLVEHHHCCHSVHKFQFCKTCNKFLMSNEQAETHVCLETKDSPHLPLDSSLLKKGKRRGSRRCFRCGLIFSRLIQYISHIRSHTGKTPYHCDGCGLYFSQSGSLRRHKKIPGRCKNAQLSVTETDVASKESEITTETESPPPQNPITTETESPLQQSPITTGTESLSRSPDALIKETKETSQKDRGWNKPYKKLPECYVKLVDISKTHLCSLCGKNFLTASRAKKHFYNIHKKGKQLSVSLKVRQCTTNHSDEKTQRQANETIAKYKCPLCPRLFKYSYNRARHLRDCVKNSVYGGKDKISGKYRCPLCHVTFTLPGNRYRHIRTFCLRECVNRLAKEGANSKEHVKQSKTKEIEQTTQPKLNEQSKRPKEMEQKKLTPLALTCPKPVPRYKCSICPAVFFHASGRSRHVRKHELSELTGKTIRYRNSVLPTLSKPDNLRNAKTEESKDSPKPTEANESLALSCNFCGRCFETPQSLKKHVRNHRGEKPYSCMECGKRFKKRAHLIAHKSIHQRRIQCTVCRKILPTVRELIQHRSSHLKRGMLRCPDCPQQFQYPAHLLRHLPTHKNKENKTKSQDRSQCEETSIRPQQSMESVKEQRGPNELQCTLCKEVFDDAQVLRKHCLTHISGSSSHQCPFCKQYFSNRRYLLRHMVIHTGNKPLSCSNCGRQFYRDLYLKLHREKCLPVRSSHLVTVEPDTKIKRPHQCSHCPRSFSKKMRLINHHHAHKANTLLICSRCGQYFGCTKLNQHQKNCTGTSEPNTVLASPDGTSQAQTESQNVSTMPLKSNATKLLHFKCPHCPKSFRFRSLLLRHLVSHTGVQPYACMHCGCSFRTRTMCLQHEALCNGVSEEGQSEVKIATATQLSKKPSLRVAAQTPQAEGEAEFKCKFCTKTFMKSQSLRRHILTHNEVKPYRCKTCESCFSRYDHLKVHQARCKGKKTQLQVCIPKISLDYVGTGWQNKIGMAPAEKHETLKCEVCSTSFSSQSQLSRHVTMFHVIKLFKCTRCGSSFAHERSLKKHRKRTKCRKLRTAPNALSPPENKPPTENVTNSLKGVRSTILQRVHPYLNKNYKHTCSYCPRVFQNSWQLAVHIRLHTGERPYACNDCGERFIRKDYLQRHSTKCTKRRCNSTPSLPRSTVCQSQQSPPKSPPKGFSCAYCTSRFLLFSQLQEHFLNAHKLETKVPPMSTAPLQHHLSNIPNVKEEPLDETCDKQLSKTGDNLICKLDTAFDSEVPNSLSCPECNMSFTNKAGLSSHLRVHSSEHPYHCKICKKGFWNKNVLRNHNRKCRFGCISVKKTTQPNQEVPLKAEIDFVLNDPVLVFKEASKSSGTGVLQTNFTCKDDLAGESPDNSEGNQMQSSTVKAKKAVQYQCSECEMSFTDGLMLISHLEDHGRQEQAKKHNTCLECGQTFASQGNLARHMRIHGTEKKYPCPDCPKIIDTPSDLEIHRTCHDPNRPFMCKLCNHRFWTRPSLCNHYREEHSDDAFACRFCNKAYLVKKSLARHYRRWHQKEQRDLATTVQEKSSAEQQSSGQVITPGESDEDENTGSEDSHSDSAPYFPCHVCGKTFPTSESLEDHQRCHLGEKPHECGECGRCFFQASQLQQHQRMHKSEFQCQACGRGFVSLFALRKHKHTHGKSRPYRCSKCDFSFTGPLQLAEHMSTHREENFPCDICNLVFGSKISRAEHRKCHSKSGAHPPPSLSKKEHEKSASISENSAVSEIVLKYRCGVCGERFRDPEELSEHGCMAAKERPYSCSDCDKHFLHASHLKMHRTTHQLSWSVNEYHCNQCNNSYSTSQGFLSHLMSHDDTAAESQPNTEGTSGGLSRNFTCPVCQQCFASATELIRHFPIHPGGTFECKMCKMTFTSRSKLEEHKRLHMTSATEFECTECGQSFLGRDAFCQHRCTLQKHTTRKAAYPNPSAKKPPPSYCQAAGEDEEIDVTGEDMYNCPVCSMQFSSKSGLLEHQNKQHHGEKPFKCDLCEKTFARRRYLREHERRHRQKIMAQQKLRCTQCRAEFGTSHDLTLHMRLHAEKEVGEFRCDMCYKSFSQWSHLKQHQESHVGQVVYECTECDKAFAFPHLLEEHQQTHAVSSQ